MYIKVLGPGCPNCHKMHDMAKNAVSELGVDATVEYVTDMVEIMKNVTATPGLVINGKVKHAGKPLPTMGMIKMLIKEEMG
jgi:small redox-active disulfide protein 2